MPAKRLYLYAEPSASTLVWAELAAWVRGLLPWLPVEVRPPFLSRYLNGLPLPEREARLDSLSWAWARARVQNPQQPLVAGEPLPGEVAYERRRLADPASRTFGILYDGEYIQALCRDILPSEEAGLDHIHVVFTNQLLGTFDEGDRRYHLRTSLYGIPSLISTNGLVEAPAKPREYYLLKQQYTALGMGDAAALLEPKFGDCIVVPDDPRLTDIVKGYAAQSLFYHLTGDPFCPDPKCRLFNAHWQEEVLRAQLGGDYEFCPSHRALLERWR